MMQLRIFSCSTTFILILYLAYGAIKAFLFHIDNFYLKIKQIFEEPHHVLHPKTINPQSINNLILVYRWCDSFTGLFPFLQNELNKYLGDLMMAKVDVDRFGKLAYKYEVRLC